MLGSLAMLLPEMNLAQMARHQKSNVQVHRIFEGGTPIVLFGNSILVSFRKRGVMVKLQRRMSG